MKEKSYENKDIFHILYGGDTHMAPITLQGTTNMIWRVYAEEVDLTFIVDKHTSLIEEVLKGKQPLEL